MCIRDSQAGLEYQAGLENRLEYQALEYQGGEHRGGGGGGGVAFRCWATTQHSFRGSFSAGSTPIFTSKYAFCSVFQDLQENHLLACKLAKIPSNFSKFCAVFSLNFMNFTYFQREKAMRAKKRKTSPKIYGSIIIIFTEFWKLL